MDSGPFSREISRRGFLAGTAGVARHTGRVIVETPHGPAQIHPHLVEGAS